MNRRSPLGVASALDGKRWDARGDASIGATAASFPPLCQRHPAFHPRPLPCGDPSSWKLKTSPLLLRSARGFSAERVRGHWRAGYFACLFKSEITHTCEHTKRLRNQCLGRDLEEQASLAVSCMSGLDGEFSDRPRGNGRARAPALHSFHTTLRVATWIHAREHIAWNPRAAPADSSNFCIRQLGSWCRKSRDFRESHIRPKIECGNT
jgi:hypothetical protein